MWEYFYDEMNDERLLVTRCRLCSRGRWAIFSQVSTFLVADNVRLACLNRLLVAPGKQQSYRLRIVHAMSCEVEPVNREAQQLIAFGESVRCLCHVSSCARC